jgi:putative acetyltransferase
MAMTERATDIMVREFLPEDGPVFRRLNEEWISRFFALEEKDQETLGDPQTKILDRGGRIFLALRDGQVVGCCALIAIGDREFELAKMAVTRSHQGAGIGRYLLEQVIAAARAAGTRRLYLETNHGLHPALRLYESLGFRPLPPERIVRSPYARADVYMELLLS